MQIRPIKNAVGIDIGASQVKIVQTSGGLARRVITAPLMRGLIQDGRIVSKVVFPPESRPAPRKGRKDALLRFDLGDRRFLWVDVPCQGRITAGGCALSLIHI